MANLPENATYGGDPGNVPVPSSGAKYTPSTAYKSLSKLRGPGDSSFKPDAPALPGTPEYNLQKQVGVSQYGSMVNNGKGIPFQTQFLPPVGDQNTPIPMPDDYGTFAPPASFNEGGQKLSWGTPTTPVIRNMGGDVPGQYVQDTSNPNLLVKTIRGTNTAADNSIRDGRPGFMSVIDHIVPLELGGADTLANRELLTPDQNFQKTVAQAVPYTLYAYGDISLSQARAMAMQWKDRDLTDIPKPNGIGLVSDSGNKSGIDIAREAQYRWTQPKPTTFKDMMAGVPQAMKDLGKGFLPDPIREFAKGALSGATLGFMPYQQGENEGLESKIAGIAGEAVGGLASFMLGGEILDGALALGGVATGAFQAWRGVAAAETVAAGLGGAEALAGAAEGAGAVAEGLDAAKASETTFKSLNKVPGYLKGITSNPATVSRLTKFVGTSVMVGQASQFVQNKFNPYTLGGLAPEKDAGMQGTIKNILGEVILGATTGIIPPTLKGTAYAVALPLAMTYIANPHDPAAAITNGVIFGAMHGMGTFNEPGYNNIESFGGDPYKNPVIQAFEQTANRTAYAPLSNYAPDILPPLEPGAMVPETAHVQETVQAAKDAAIKNIWTRFFNGKDTSPEAKAKTLEDFKGFAQNVDTTLDNMKKPELSLTEKFDPSKRRAANTELKEQKATLKDQFGKGYQTRNVAPGDTANLPEGGMDLQTALTEIKRVTVAARQLYKGGLTGEMRNLADVNDLLSFGKAQLNNRFDAQERFVNPPIARQAVDSIDDSFMNYSFDNNRSNSPGKYPNGDMALTGAALDINAPATKYFFAQKKLGNASPNILLVDRPDMAPIWRMGDALIDPNDILAKKYAVDPNPENSLQAFGVVKDPNTGQKALVPLSWVASEFRLNEATGQGHVAYNQHEAVTKWKTTGGQEGLRPLDLSKDDIVPSMRKNGISVLVANLDPRATESTVENQKPFIPLNINDNNWEYSKQLGDRLSQQQNKNPISMEVSKVANALGAKQKSEAIAKMNQVIEKPASAYIPPSTGKQSSVGSPFESPDVVSPVKETTRGVLQTLEKSLDVADPNQLKAAFQKNFGMLLPDEQAADIFNRRNEIKMRDGVKLLADAVNSGNTDALTKMKLGFAKTYLESGALQAFEGGKAVPDMPILGKMKKGMPTGQEEHLATPDMVTPTNNKPLDIQNYNNADPALTRYPSQSMTQDASLPGNVINSNIETPAVSQEGLDSLPERISSIFQKEYLNIKKPASVSNPMSSSAPVDSNLVSNLIKSYLPEGSALLEDAKAMNGGYNAPDHESVIAGMEKKIQTELQGKNVPANVISQVQEGIRSELQNQGDFNTSKTIEDIEKPSPEDFFGKSVKNPSPYSGGQHPVTGEDVPAYLETPPHELLTKPVHHEDMPSGPALTREEAAKYFKTKGYTFESPELQKLANSKTAIPWELLAENPEYTRELNKYIPKDTKVLEKPRLFAKEYYNNIDEGLKSERPGTQYHSKALDMVLKTISPYGENYRSDPNLPQVLDNFYKEHFFNEVNSKGREITSPKKVFEARQAGDKNAEFAAMRGREIEILKGKGLTDPQANDLIAKYNRIKYIPQAEMDKVLPPDTFQNYHNSNKYGGLSPEEMSDRGLEAGGEEEGFKHMGVSTRLQGDEMVHDLTQGEDAYSPIISDTSKRGAAESVRAVKLLMTGSSGNMGLREYLINNLPGAKSSQIKLAPLETEAVALDNKNSSTGIKNLSDLIDTQVSKIDQALKGTKDRPYDSVAKMEEELKQSKSELETVQKMINDSKNDPNEPLPAGLTPDLIKGTVTDLMAKYKRIIQSIKDSEADGTGGPDIHDGMGGPGGFFGMLWDKLKNGNSTTYTFPDKKPSFDSKKFMDSIAANETSVVNGDPYSTWQPSGSQKMGKALGKYRVTEATLQAHAPQFLGQPVTTKQFLGSPSMQDNYMKNMSNYYTQKGYTPQQIADIHRSGSTLESGYRDADYVNKFNSTYNTPAISKPAELVSLGK